MVQESGGNTSGDSGNWQAGSDRPGDETAPDLKAGVRETVDEVGRQTADFAHRQKDSVAGEIRKTAQALGDASERLQREDSLIAGPLKSVCEGLNRLGDSVDSESFTALVHDVEDYGRRNPAAFIGAAVALGFFAGRFLRSSGERGGAHAATHGTYASHERYGSRGTVEPGQDGGQP